MCRSSSFSARIPLRPALAGLVAAVSLLAAFPRASWADDSLQTIRDDVRDAPPSQPSSPKKSDSGGNASQGDDALGTLFAPVFGPVVGAGMIGVGMAVSSPIWGPITVLDDNYSPGFFPHFPYEDSSGYITHDSSNALLWAVRVDGEYANDLNRLDAVGGHFLLETSYRFGLEASGRQLDQRLCDGQIDRLAIGDANLVFRFAQSDWAEFRTGLGANWLADRQATNYGFNFTYAADFFPGNPWVISTTLDAGTLGYAGLFRFRLTGGAVFHGVEAYAGYEFLDIGRTPTNSLVTGLRFWF